MAKKANLADKVKRLESERQRTAERLATCMRLHAIGQLTAGVAHELNNPLSVILGYVQGLMRPSAHPEELLPALKNVEREAQRCKRVIQSLLNFSRIPRPGKVPENIIDVLEGALSLVETQTRVQAIEVIRDFSELLPRLSIDRHRIQLMIINLCTNALDAMPKGGRLTISVSLAANPKGPPMVQIRVADTGIGIPEAIRDRIFEPFFTTKELGKGTGLGLRLVQEVVEEHDGQIEFQSAPNQGTTFTIRIPAHTRMSAPRDRSVAPSKTPAPRV